MKSFLIAIRSTVVFLIICGFIYPLTATGIAQVLFPKQAEGSLISKNGKVVGSELIAQKFNGAEWFHPRASAADYNPKESAGANAAVASQQYIKALESRINLLKKENADMGKTIPADLVTTSASGLDPDLSPEAALAQVPRISKATGISTEKLISLIKQYTSGRSLGIFGEPHVNVLELNLALQTMDNKGLNS